MSIEARTRLGGMVVAACLAAGTVAAQEPDATGSSGVHRIERKDLNHGGGSGPSLLRDIGTDFKVFFTSTDTYLTLGVGLAASSAVRPLDDRITLSRLNGELRPSTTLDRTFEAGEVLGGSLVQLGGAAATYGIGHLVRHRGMAALGRDLIRAQVLNGALTQTIKYAAGRRRPDGTSRRSFPSGHASGTFATAAVLQQHYGWKVGAPALAVASYVAASRLSENKHYLSDVVLGAAIGLAAGRAVTFGLRQTRFEIVPVATAGGAGVQVAVTGF